MEDAYARLRRTGDTRDAGDRLLSFDRFNEIVGVEEKYALDAKFRSDVD
jgi:hypothetical protein